jgi:hypothetical protein
MRVLLLGLMALCLTACGDKHDAAQGPPCTASAEHALRFSDNAADDTIVAQADGPRCADAAVTLTLRNAAGDELWSFASTYNAMTHGGGPVVGEAAPRTEDVQRFLASWADVTVKRSGELPAWRAGAASPGEGLALSYETQLSREAYEALRARNLATICFAASVDTSQCLVINQTTPTIIVAFGP